MVSSHLWLMAAAVFYRFQQSLAFHLLNSHHFISMAGMKRSGSDLKAADFSSQIQSDQNFLKNKLENNHDDDTSDSESIFGYNDQDFEQMMSSRFHKEPLYEKYPETFHLASAAVTKWRQRYRGNKVLWRRIFKEEKVVKEVVEAMPVIHAVRKLILESDQTDFTIVDLACGKGYLSMLLSEILPPEKVKKCVLIDKAWPLCNAEAPLPHQMNWDHIYGNRTDGQGTYFQTWPIPLHTSKQDLKHTCNRRALKKRLFDPAPGPVVMLAIHLCGILSLRAVDMFNQNENIRFFALKPCCLPGLIHVQREEIFTIGTHSFDSTLVCAAGRWSSKKWVGPPRWHLEDRFNAWAENLFLGVETTEEDCKMKTKVMVQTNGGYQNSFVFAQRAPKTAIVWDRLKQDEDLANKAVKSEFGVDVQ